MTTTPPSFERAEYGIGAAGAAPCARCQRPLAGRFFRLSGEPLCEPCANAAMTAPAEGAHTAFVKALMVGIVATVMGCVLYAAVEIGTGWTIGYVALAVGWLVGKGMKWGGEGRGGRRYQIASVVLTYLSVSLAEAVVILYFILKQSAGAHLALGEGLLVFLLKYGLLSPLLDLRDGINGILGLVILFIGLRAAWVLTAGSEYRITGPHLVSGGSAA